ncbi:hypothetical protein D3C75_1325660 [compost metagenome]
MAGQRADDLDAGREEVEQEALPDVLGGTVDAVLGDPGSPVEDVALQSEHGLSGAGGLQASVGLGNPGAGTGNERVPDSC